jgi:hypothetical protein
MRGGAWWLWVWLVVPSVAWAEVRERLAVLEFTSPRAVVQPEELKILANLRCGRPVVGCVSMAAGRTCL